MKPKLRILLFLLSFPLMMCGQKAGRILWLDFPTLEDSLHEKPKKTFVYFYAGWCVYCKKMDRNTFKDPKVIDMLSTDYYAVKMDVETRDTIEFEGQRFYNDQAMTTRNPVHQMPLLLAKRKDKPFTLPAILILDENFRLINRSFHYLTGQQLYNLLQSSDNNP